MTRLFIFSAAILILTLALSAGAAPHLTYSRHALSVRLDDLNLARPEDVLKLRARVDAAAEEVCGGRPDRDNRYSDAEQKLLWPAFDKCRADAIRRAVAMLKAQGPARTADAAPEEDFHKVLAH